MSATVIILPVVARPRFDDPEWVAQQRRLCGQVAPDRPPAHSRPRLVVSNPDPASALACAIIQFDRAMRDLRACFFSDDVDPRRR